MSKRKGPIEGDYEVGYGKPPKHTRWVPGQSGFKGRKKKRATETQAEIIARVRDEMVTVNGQTMTKFELAVHSTFTQTVKAGKPRDLKLLIDMLEKYGLLSEPDRAAQAHADSEYVLRKIGQHVERTFNYDPKDAAMIDKLNTEEVMIVMSCKCCSERLRRRWKDPDYEALRERYRATQIHGWILYGERRRHINSMRPLPKPEI